jgi:hypothetical protein
VDRVVGYVPDPAGVSDSRFIFPSLDSAQWILGHMGIYLATDLATLPGDLPAPR